ncbi:E2F-associated phosphoprotein-domain-containing protein [Gamsiella multidivaricata]|uniref:E2F-associated phosphoprotein-domain-containing protein n=1 Tax=Gamsiella multidivaricata TaxID=101098 RepID=UPI002220F275|nr:E2F-associated phosphoprotein-domain-containing protein [Gamsiella multidivaricata]KAG0364886.1 hypothetical protein BGZ54_007056 [Gamsiella multidivaricata]KAI7826589.1 E2F-associated phosphoprotein-domain-containing protein [Gamsiella multidivaricata]
MDMNTLLEPSAAGRKVHFGADHSESDSESNLHELPDSTSTKPEEPDYYDPIYFDSDEDDSDSDDETGSRPTKVPEEQDDDEKEFDARAGIPTSAGTSTAENNMKDLTTGLAQSSLGPSSSTSTSTSTSTSAPSGKSSKKNKKKHRIMSDAELLYDPDEDDRDQDWLIKKIAANRPPGSNPEDIWTDAILSCPMCLTQLCFDCQQHEFYSHQFRAMFVENCRVIENEVLRFPKEAKKKQPPKSGRNAKSTAGAASTPLSSSSSSSSAAAAASTSDPAQGFKPSEYDDEDMAYHPVVCEICNTKVALFDQDEVYHYFNVIPTPV